jgi:hypothetical protein
MRRRVIRMTVLEYTLYMLPIPKKIKQFLRNECTQISGCIDSEGDGGNDDEDYKDNSSYWSYC